MGIDKVIEEMSEWLNQLKDQLDGLYIIDEKGIRQVNKQLNEVEKADIVNFINTYDLSELEILLKTIKITNIKPEQESLAEGYLFDTTKKLLALYTLRNNLQSERSQENIIAYSEAAEECFKALKILKEQEKNYIYEQQAIDNESDEKVVFQINDLTSEEKEVSRPPLQVLSDLGEKYIFTDNIKVENKDDLQNLIKDLKKTFNWKQKYIKAIQEITTTIDLDIRDFNAKLKNLEPTESKDSVYQHAKQLQKDVEKGIENLKPFIEKLEQIERQIKLIESRANTKDNKELKALAEQHRDTLRRLSLHTVTPYTHTYNTVINILFQIKKQQEEINKIVAKSEWQLRAEPHKRDLIEQTINPVIANYFVDRYAPINGSAEFYIPLLNDHLLDKKTNAALGKILEGAGIKLSAEEHQEFKALNDLLSEAHAQRFSSIDKCKEWIAAQCEEKELSLSQAALDVMVNKASFQEFLHKESKANHPPHAEDDNSNVKQSESNEQKPVKLPELNYLEVVLSEEMIAYRYNRSILGKNRYHDLSKEIEDQIKDFSNSNKSDKEKFTFIKNILQDNIAKRNPNSRNDKKFINALNRILEKFAEYQKKYNAKEESYVDQMENSIKSLEAIKKSLEGLSGKSKQTPLGISFSKLLKAIESNAGGLPEHYLEAVEYFKGVELAFKQPLKSMKEKLNELDSAYQHFKDSTLSDDPRFKERMAYIEMHYAVLDEFYDDYNRQYNDYAEKIAEISKEINIDYRPRNEALKDLIDKLESGQNLLLVDDNFVIKQGQFTDKDIEASQSKAAFNKLLQIVEQDMADGYPSWPMLDKVATSDRGRALLANNPELQANYKSLNDKIVVELAEGLKTISKELFLRIPNNEILDFQHHKEQARCPNICAYTANFNDISDYVTNAILREKNIAARAVVMERWVRVMEACLSKGNIHAAFAIHSVFGRAEIYRLRSTFGGLSQHAASVLSNCEKLFSTNGSYKYLRKFISNLKDDVIPFLGLVQTDLVFAAEGNITVKLTDENRERELLKVKAVQNMLERIDEARAKSIVEVNSPLSEILRANIALAEVDDTATRDQKSKLLEPKGGKIPPTDFVVKFISSDSDNEPLLFTVPEDDQKFKQPNIALELPKDPDKHKEWPKAFQVFTQKQIAYAEQFDKDLPADLDEETLQSIKQQLLILKEGKLTDSNKNLLINTVSKTLNKLIADFEEFAQDKIKDAKKDIEILSKENMPEHIRSLYMEKLLKDERWKLKDDGLELFAPQFKIYQDTIDSLDSLLAEVKQYETAGSFKQLSDSISVEVNKYKALFEAKHQEFLKLKEDLNNRLSKNNQAYANVDKELFNRFENRAIRKLLHEGILLLPQDIKPAQIALFNISAKNNTPAIVKAELDRLKIVITKTDDKYLEFIVEAQKKLGLIKQIKNTALQKYLSRAPDNAILGLTEEYVAIFNKLDHQETLNLLRDKLNLSPTRKEYLSIELLNDAKLFKATVFFKVFERYSQKEIKDLHAIEELNQLFISKRFNRVECEQLLEKIGLGSAWLDAPVSEAEILSVLKVKAPCATWWELIQEEQKRIYQIRRLAHPVLRKMLIANPKVVIDDSIDLSSLNTFSSLLTWSAASARLKRLFPSLVLEEKQYRELHQFNLMVERIGNNAYLDKYAKSLDTDYTQLSYNLTKIATCQDVLYDAKHRLPSLEKVPASAADTIINLTEQDTKLQKMEVQLKERAKMLSKLFTGASKTLSPTEQEVLNNIILADIPFDEIEEYKDNNILRTGLLVKQTYEQWHRVSNLRQEMRKILQHLTFKHFVGFKDSINDLEKQAKLLDLEISKINSDDGKIAKLEQFVKQIEEKIWRLPEIDNQEIDRVRETLNNLLINTEEKIAATRSNQQKQEVKQIKAAIDNSTIKITIQTESQDLAAEVLKPADNAEPIKVPAAPINKAVKQTWTKIQQVDKYTRYTHHSNLEMVNDKAGLSFYQRPSNKDLPALQKDEYALCSAWADVLATQVGDGVVVLGGTDPNLQKIMALELQNRSIRFTFENKHENDITPEKAKNNAPRKT